MAASFRYSIDTSSLIRWYVEIYTPAILPKLPERMEALAEEGRLISPESVRAIEIKAGDDLHKWVKAQKALFIPETQEVQGAAKQLMAAHHNPAKPHKGITGCDPLVIGLALTEGCCVVADEHDGSQENRKIPFVCKASKVECITFLQMMEREKWTFT